MRHDIFKTGRQLGKSMTALDIVELEFSSKPLVPWIADAVMNHLFSPADFLSFLYRCDNWRYSVEDIRAVCVHIYANTPGMPAWLLTI